jgi:hypothetical protein
MSDPQEDTFWTTPGERRTLQFKNELLIDEDVDLANVTSSFSTPVVAFRSTVPRVPPTGGLPFQEEGIIEYPAPEDSTTLEDTFDHTTKAPDSNVDTAEQLDDQTMSVAHKPGSPSLQSLPPITSEPRTPIVDTDQVILSSTGSLVHRTRSSKKIRLTSDAERIAVCGNETCLRYFVSEFIIGKNMGYCWRFDYAGKYIRYFRKWWV